MMKNATRYIKRSAALLLISAIGLSSLFGCAASENGANETTAERLEGSVSIDQGWDSQVKNAETMFKVAEHNSMALYVKGNDASVVLKDEISGYEWRTNPADIDKDPLAQGINRDFLNSQIILEYVESGKTTKVDSYSQSVALDQYAFYQIENGIGVQYTIGEKPHMYVVPRALSIERYEEVKNKIADELDLFTFESYYKKVSLDELSTEADKALFLKTFPILREHPIYYFDTTGTIGFHAPGEQVASDFLMEQVEAVFLNAGYTSEDMKQDHAENKVNIPEKPDFSVALCLEYRLDEFGLRVTVPQNSIKYNKKQIQVVNIWLTPYFGAADSKAEGYMLVPGGSGSLIYLNNGKTYMEPYESELVYGEDPVFEKDPTEPDVGVQPYLPVYGMKNGSRGFVAVVEDGDGSVFIEADISGRSNSYNHVGPRFQVSRPQHQDSVIINLTDFDVYPDKDLACDLEIRFMPLQGENANYSGMANAYRRYLIENKKIKQNEVGTDIPFHLRTIGAVTYKKPILGVPVNRPKSLTTYDETRKIIDELYKSGVRNIAVELSDWANGGRENTVYSGIDLMGTLGGRKEFLALTDYITEHQLQLFPGMEWQYIGKDKWTDGFNAKKDAARKVNKRIAYNYDYKLSSYEKIKGSSRTVVAPFRYESLIDAVLDDLSGYRVNGISVKNLGHTLCSDFNPKHTSDRQNSLNTASSQLEKISDKYAVLVPGANAYTLPYASLITDVSLTSENHYMCDESVPFYQMVVHGLIPVAGAPMNYSDDFKTDTLRLIESGCVPSFEFIYRDNYELKDTRYNIYGVNYKLWMDQAVELYSQVNAVLKDCQTAYIVKHETVRNDVKCTTYSNGISVVVNYSGEDVEYAGETVKAKSFLRLEGENVND